MLQVIFTRNIREAHDPVQDKMQELYEMREVIRSDALGWVPGNEQLTNLKECTISRRV